MENQKQEQTPKEFTYEDCIWYMEDLDRCKLPGHDERYSTCWCKEQGKVKSFCKWVTEFLTPTEDEHKQIQLELFDFNDPLGLGGSSDLAPESYYDDLYERAYNELKKIIDSKEKTKDGE